MAYDEAEIETIMSIIKDRSKVSDGEIDFCIYELMIEQDAEELEKILIMLNKLVKETTARLVEVRGYIG